MNEKKEVSIFMKNGYLVHVFPLALSGFYASSCWHGAMGFFLFWLNIFIHVLFFKNNRFLRLKQLRWAGLFRLPLLGIFLFFCLHNHCEKSFEFVAGNLLALGTWVAWGYIDHRKREGETC